MSKEIAKQLIQNIAPRISDVALRINTGRTGNDWYPVEGKVFEATTISRPKSEWAQIVDSIEDPFVVDYDQEEYQKNPALNLMGLYEMKMMLKGFGLSSLGQANYFERPFSGKNYLVAGCGTGREVFSLAALGGNVTGIDATKGYVDLTADKLTKVVSVLDPTSEIKLFQCPAEDYPYEPFSFDAISSLFGVINHIRDWKKQLKRFAYALKNDGKLVIEKYGSDDALIFKLRKTGQMEYDPSILQRRDSKGKGILLGDSEDVLPANFPNDRQFRNQLADNGFQIQNKTGFLRIAALFPKEPTAKNLKMFLDLVRETDVNAYDFLYQFKSADELLLAAFMYDLQSQKRKENPVDIEDFAYVLYIGRKKCQEEYPKGFNR